MHDKVILFVPDGADSILIKIPSYIKAERSDRYMNFESCAYDAIFRTFYDLEREGFQQLAQDISEALILYRGSGSLLPVSVQEDMKNLKNRLSVLLQRISAMNSLLQDLIADEEEMSLMNLTYLSKRQHLYRYGVHIYRICIFINLCIYEFTVISNLNLAFRYRKNL